MKKSRVEYVKIKLFCTYQDILKIAPAPVPELPPVLPEVARNDIDIDVIESADPIGEVRICGILRYTC